MEPMLCELKSFNLEMLHGFSLGGCEELPQKRGQVWGKKRLFVILSRVEQRLFQIFPVLTKMKCPKPWAERPLLCPAGVRQLQEGGWEVLCSPLHGAGRALTVSPQRERHLGPGAAAPVPEPERALPEEEQHQEPG